MKKANIPKLNRDAQGNIVLRVAHYYPTGNTYTVVSVYGFTGVKNKRMTVLVREKFLRHAHTREELATIKDNLAHLWAMQQDVGNYVIHYGGAMPAVLYHPTELENQP